MTAPAPTSTGPGAKPRLSARLGRPAGPLPRERQRAVLLAALLTVVVEIASLLRVIPSIDLGRVSISPTLVPAAVVLALLGRRAWGRPGSREAAGPYWAAAGLGLVFGTTMLAADRHAFDAAAVMLAALDEEVVFRFAIPTVVAAMLISLQARVRPARIAGFAVGAVWFVLLPGHRAQMTDPAQVLPFIAFASLAALVVYRSGSLLATAAAHSVMNMLTILAFGEELGRTARGLAIGCLLVLLVAAYGQNRRVAVAPAGAAAAGAGTGPGDRGPGGIDLTAPLEDGRVIDLRDGMPPTVTHPDGTVTPVGDPEPAETEADAPH